MLVVEVLLNLYKKATVTELKKKSTD